MTVRLFGGAHELCSVVALTFRCSVFVQIVNPITPDFLRHMPSITDATGQQTAAQAIAASAEPAAASSGAAAAMPAAATMAAQSTVTASGAEPQAGGLGLTGLPAPLLSQVPMLLSDRDASEEHFPSGAVDVNGQQVCMFEGDVSRYQATRCPCSPQSQIDLRSVNSWRLRLDEIPAPEAAEVCVRVDMIVRGSLG
jgi:hypothetical protein